MNKHERAILDYESKRQCAAKLEKKRNDLIARCTKNDPTDYNSRICLTRAYEDTKKIINDNNEYYSFEEILDNGHAEGDYCENCFKAYTLKKVELATARKEFGNAKRRLSYLGKALIRNSNNPE